MSPLCDFPDPAPRLPRRGNRLTRIMACSLMKSGGWRFEGQLPNLPKAVVIVAPHTSNWDFFVGVTAMYALGTHFSWLGKCTVFRGPLGTIMRWLGGIPVDRSASHGIVDQIVATFNAADQLLLGLSPEGTRSAVERWHNGFWHIARGAQVPIVPVSLDYARRVVGFETLFKPSDDMQSDLSHLHSIFANVTPRRAEGLGA